VEVVITVQLLRRKFTVEQYQKMIESGILTKYDRVELIRGEIIEMSLKSLLAVKLYQFQISLMSTIPTFD
jgi:hypothetical protein